MAMSVAAKVPGGLWFITDETKFFPHIYFGPLNGVFLYGSPGTPSHSVVKEGEVRYATCLAAASFLRTQVV